MSKDLMVVNPKDFGIEEKTASELTVGLQQIIDERALLIKEFETVSKLEITEESIPKFKSLRLKVQRNRTQGINQWHKAGKEYFLRGGQFLDALRRKEILVNENMEEVLMNGEKHYENLEKERLEKLQDYRAEMLRPYVEDASERDLIKFEDDEFEAFLRIKKEEYNAKIEAEKKAEKERIAKEKAEAEERLRIKAENEQLKKEAEKREVEEKKRKAKEEKERKLREEAEAKRQKEIEEKQLEEKIKHEKQLKVERERAENLAKELKAKEEAERKLREEAEAKRQAELNKGDESKLNDLIEELNILKSKYTFKSDKNKKMYESTGLLIDKVINYIKNK